MSSFNRRTFLLAPLALTACGFEPVYGTGGTAQNLRGKILVDTPTDQDSFDMAAQLEQRLGRAQAPIYALKVTTTIDEEGLAISGSNDIERFNLIGVAAYTLTRLGTKETVLKGRVNTFTAYSASQQPVATLAAERDATRRLMLALADKITAELLINSDQL
jgi:LPS-assembly lipoprotein